MPIRGATSYSEYLFIEQQTALAKKLAKFCLLDSLSCRESYAISLNPCHRDKITKLLSTTGKVSIIHDQFHDRRFRQIEGSFGLRGDRLDT
jgi:hypothetical protein